MSLSQCDGLLAFPSTSCRYPRVDHFRALFCFPSIQQLTIGGRVEDEGERVGGRGVRIGVTVGVGVRVGSIGIPGVLLSLELLYGLEAERGWREGSGGGREGVTGYIGAHTGVLDAGYGREECRGCVGGPGVETGAGGGRGRVKDKHIKCQSPLSVQSCSITTSGTE